MISTTKLAQQKLSSYTIRCDQSHITHKLSTDLSWDGQFLILWQQLRKEAVWRGDLAVEDREQGSDEYIHTLLHYLFYY